MQTIAYLTMIINHFFGYEWLGMAMPIFAWCCATGLKKTRNKEIYIIRVLFFGLISQFYWPFRVGTNQINDLLAMGITMLALEDNYKSDILKVTIFVGWLNGVIAMEYLFFIILANIGFIYFSVGLILYTVIVYSEYSLIHISNFFLVPVLIYFYERKILTFDLLRNYKYKYLIYPIHLGLIECSKFF